MLTSATVEEVGDGRLTRTNPMLMLMVSLEIKATGDVATGKPTQPLEKEKETAGAMALVIGQGTTGTDILIGTKAETETDMLIVTETIIDLGIGMETETETDTETTKEIETAIPDVLVAGEYREVGNLRLTAELRGLSATNLLPEALKPAKNRPYPLPRLQFRRYVLAHLP